MTCLLSVFPSSMGVFNPLVRFLETYGRLPSIPFTFFSCPIAALVAENYIGAQSLAEDSDYIGAQSLYTKSVGSVLFGESGVGSG